MILNLIKIQLKKKLSILRMFEIHPKYNNLSNLWISEVKTKENVGKFHNCNKFSWTIEFKALRYYDNLYHFNKN